MDLVGHPALHPLQLGRKLLSDSSLSTGATVAYAFVCVGLVLFSGVMSGLTLGLLSLDKWAALEGCGALRDGLAACPPPPAWRAGSAAATLVDVCDFSIGDQHHLLRIMY